MLSFGEYLAGMAFLLPTLGACVAAGVVLTGRRFAGLAGAPAVVAAGLLASAALVVAHLLPLALGVLTRGTVVIVALACLGLALALGRTRTEAGPAAPEPPASGRGSLMLAGAGVAIVVLWSLAYVKTQTTVPVTAVDALTMHFPQTARWVQTGSVWQLDQFAADLSFATYPQSGNLMQLALTLPFGDLFAARFMAVPFVALAGVALYAAGVELGAPRATAALAAAAVIAIPVIQRPAFELAQVDAPLLAWFAGGGLFLLRTSRHRAGRELVLAGLGLGLAFGTKWYAVPDVPVVIGVWALALLVARVPLRAVVTRAAGLSAVVLLAGGFWLVRNWVEAGNPFHPSALRPLGITIFDAPPDEIREQAGFAIAHYLLDTDIWRDYFLPVFLDDWGWTAPLLGLSTVAVLAFAALRLRRGRPDAGNLLRMAAVAVAALGMAVVYVNLPFTAFGLEGRPVLTGANTRYLVPALLAAAPLAAWVAGRAGRARLAAEAVLLVVAIDTVRRALPEPAPRGVVVAAAGVAGAVALAVALRRVLADGGRNALRIATAVVLVAVPAVVAGAVVSDRAQDINYARVDPVLAWLERNAPAGQRIGLAGTWSLAGVSPVTTAFGRELDNHVEIVGRFRDGTLRAPASERAFVDAVARSRLGLLVVGTGPYHRPPAAVREYRWARAAGFSPVAGSKRLVVLARRRPG